MPQGTSKVPMILNWIVSASFSLLFDMQVAVMTILSSCGKFLSHQTDIQDLLMNSQMIATLRKQIMLMTWLLMCVCWVILFECCCFFVNLKKECVALSIWHAYFTFDRASLVAKFAERSVVCSLAFAPDGLMFSSGNTEGLHMWHVGALLKDRVTLSDVCMNKFILLTLM